MRAPAVSGAASYPCCFKEDVAMRTFDFSPFARNAIGFDTLFDLLNDRQMKTAKPTRPTTLSGRGRMRSRLTWPWRVCSGRHHYNVRGKPAYGVRQEARRPGDRVPLPGNFGPGFPAAFQSRRLHRGRERLVLKRAAPYQLDPTHARKHEAPAIEIGYVTRLDTEGTEGGLKHIATRERGRLRGPLLCVFRRQP